MKINIFSITAKAFDWFWVKCNPHEIEQRHKRCLWIINKCRTSSHQDCWSIRTKTTTLHFQLSVFGVPTPDVQHHPDINTHRFRFSLFRRYIFHFLHHFHCLFLHLLQRLAKMPRSGHPYDLWRPTGIFSSSNLGFSHIHDGSNAYQCQHEW